MELRVLSLYPEQMNIYADRGNILFLQRRCEWRGIGFSHAGAGPGDAIDPAAHDLFYIGGGQDRDQRMVAADMVATQARRAGGGGRRTARPCSPSAAATSCSATATSSARRRLPGLGLADLETVREPGPRLIGNVAIEVDLGAGPARPGRLREPRRPHLPRTRRRSRSAASSAATATTARDGLEGVRRDNLIGTYLHGPLLPKNAWLADHLIALALERRYGARPELEPLDDALRGRRPRAAPAPRPGSGSSGLSGRSSRSRRRRGRTRSSALASTGSAIAIGDEHQLGDPVARLDPEGLRRVGVEQQHPQLAAVAGVDQARGC